MADNQSGPQGNGLAEASEAGLNSNGESAHASPPAYTSAPAAIPDVERIEAFHRSMVRRLGLLKLRDSSKPEFQFRHHVMDERRLVHAQYRNGRLPEGVKHDYLAYKNAKKVWEEQGLWNKYWDQFACGKWKHEEALDIHVESDTDSEPEPQVPSIEFFPDSARLARLTRSAQSNPRRPKSIAERQLKAERRAIREREREGSRPYYQFFNQVSRERELIQNESTERNDLTINSPDINTRAYENVKNKWIDRDIWSRKWGVLPGMTWMHEEDLDEEALYIPPRLASTEINDQGPGFTTNPPPRRSLFGSAPISPVGIPPSGETLLRLGGELLRQEPGRLP